MPIDQNIDSLPTPPSSGDPINFRTRADNFVAALVTFVNQLNLFRTQANTLEANVNAKEASAVAASEAAVALANYKGIFVQGVSNALVGESWSYSGTSYRCAVNTSNNPATEPASWVSTSIDAVIHAATAKTTPVDANEFGFLSSSAAWSLVKMTGTNLKAWLKTYFDTVYAVLNSPAFTGTPTAPNFSYKPTPVAITSWGYAATTITLNVASHTFVAGDYIEVGGLTATTNIPNGVHLVTSVTATTIIFTYALTPTGTAGVSSATVKGYMTTNGRAESIGVNQIWLDVTASRSFGVTYTNTTGKPIQIMARQVTSNPNEHIDVIINGSIGFVGYQTSGTTYNITSQSVIVPNGSTYQLTHSASRVVSQWLELR